MSDNIYDDDYSDESDESSNGPKALREALKKAQTEAKAKAKELEELNTKFESLNKKVTEQSLSDLLREKQVPANIAKWIKRDGIDPTAEAVDEWLKDNGDDFGYKPGEPAAAPAEPVDGLSPEEVAEMARLQELDGYTSAPSIPMDQMGSAVADIARGKPQSYEATVAALRAAGIPIESSR